MPIPPFVMLFIAMVGAFSVTMIYLSISDAFLEKSLRK